MSDSRPVRITGRPHRRGLKSAMALLVGFVAVVVLSLCTDEVLHLLKVFPPWDEVMSNGLFALATAYRAVFNVLGCYIAARLAPGRPMRHAMLLGWIGLIVALLGVALSWRQPLLGPHWYSVGLAILALPCAWAGGKLREFQLRDTAETPYAQS